MSQIIIEDQSYDLTLTHYTNATEESSVEVKRNRGKIIDGEGEVVCSSFGFTPDYVVMEDREKYIPLLTDLSKCDIFRSEEGSVLRLFFNDNRWNLSTHKRIDAFSSRWSSSKTFGEWFMTALEYFFIHGEGKGQLTFENHDELFDRFCDTLDKTIVYTFLLRTNQDTKIVCTVPDHPTLFFAGAFQNEKRVKNITLQIPSPLRVEFSTVSELEEYVTSLSPFDHQGVIVMLEDDSTIKIIHPLQSSYKLIRGSEPDITAAYFRIRNNKQDVALFTRLFPNVAVSLLEEKIFLLGKYLHSMYVRRFIKKLYTMIHPVLFVMLKKAHTWHVEDRATHIVTLDRMMEFMLEQPYSHLYRMVQEFSNNSK